MVCGFGYRVLSQREKFLRLWSQILYEVKNDPGSLILLPLPLGGSGLSLFRQVLGIKLGTLCLLDERSTELYPQFLVFFSC